MKKYALFILSALILCACASKMEEIQYYHLPAAPLEAQEALSGKNYVLVTPVVVAEYLAGSGIVYQVDSVEYKTAKNSRWAEGLSTQLQNSLADELRASLPGQMILTHRQTAPQLTVSVQINGFHGRYGGKAVVSGEWMITGGENVVMQKNFEHEVGQEADGYKSLIEALYEGWKTEAGNIAAAVKSLRDQK